MVEGKDTLIIGGKVRSDMGEIMLGENIENLPLNLGSIFYISKWK